jgi:hypothetical protein
VATQGVTASGGSQALVVFVSAVDVQHAVHGHREN